MSVRRGNRAARRERPNCSSPSYWLVNLALVGRCAQWSKSWAIRTQVRSSADRFLRRRFRGRLFVVQDLAVLEIQSVQDGLGRAAPGAPEIPAAPHPKSRPAWRSRARRPRPKSEPMPVISVFHVHPSIHSRLPKIRRRFRAGLLRWPNFCKRTGSLPYGMPVSSAIHAVLHFEIILSQKKLVRQGLCYMLQK